MVYIVTATYVCRHCGKALPAHAIARGGVSDTAGYQARAARREECAA